MAYYRECPNCSNCEDGTVIYKCGNCGKKFCDDCQYTGDGLAEKVVHWTLSSHICPSCETPDGATSEACTIGEDD